MMWKPYDLAWVKSEKGDYSYIGEVISRPTPEGTIMCRRVPGDSTTMEEIPIARLGLEAKAKYVHYAHVSGIGQFPVDMLRYDAASPVNFRIEEYSVGRVMLVPLERATKVAMIARATNRKTPNWTQGRWESFGWFIRPLKTLEIKRPE